MTFEIGWVFAEVQILKKVRLLQNDIYHRRGFAERQIRKKSENGIISWTECNILIDFCENIDIIKI